MDHGRDVHRERRGPDKRDIKLKGLYKAIGRDIENASNVYMDLQQVDLR